MNIPFLIISIVAIATVGTLAHFLYDLTNHNKFIGLFAAVNESTWEHIKIALTPMMLCGLYDGFIYGENPNYFLAKLASLVTPIIVIPCIFYGYKAIIRKRILAIDIASFFIAVALAQFIFMLIIGAPVIMFIFDYLARVGLFILFGAYAVLTLMPLELFIFKDPITHKYGFKAHSEKYNPFKKEKK